MSHRCTASDLTDPIQFAGASDFQTLNFAQYFWWFLEASYRAEQAAAEGNWEQFDAYMIEAGIYFAEASAWWTSTKLEWQGSTYWFSGYSHEEMHDVLAWNTLAPHCVTGG